MQEQFNITLPLLLGAQSLNKDGQERSQVSEIVSSTEMECNITMQTAPLMEASHGSIRSIKGEVTKC